MNTTSTRPHHLASLLLSVAMLFSFASIAQRSSAQSCDDSAWFAISNALQKSAENGNINKYEDAVMRAVAFQEACPDFAPIVEELLDRADRAFASGQTSQQVQPRSASQNIRADKASVLLMKANNSKIVGLLSTTAAWLLVVNAPQAALPLIVTGAVYWIRSISCERRAAKRLAHEGL